MRMSFQVVEVYFELRSERPLALMPSISYQSDPETVPSLEYSHPADRTSWLSPYFPLPARIQGRNLDCNFEPAS